jgi:hypothetical protein
MYWSKKESRTSDTFNAKVVFAGYRHLMSIYHPKEVVLAKTYIPFPGIALHS